MAEEAVPLAAATVPSAVPPTVGTSGAPKVMNACVGAGAVVGRRAPLGAVGQAEGHGAVPVAAAPARGALPASGGVTGLGTGGAVVWGAVVPLSAPLSASVLPARAWVVPATASLPP